AGGRDRLADQAPRPGREGELTRRGDVPAREQGQALERMLPVHAVDEPVQVLDQARDLALLELAPEAVQPLRREVLHDDPVLPLRGGRPVGGGEQGQRRVIPPALEPLQLATTDHGSPPLPTGAGLGGAGTGGGAGGRGQGAPPTTARSWSICWISSSFRPTRRTFGTSNCCAFVPAVRTVRS